MLSGIKKEACRGKSSISFLSADIRYGGKGRLNL